MAPILGAIFYWRYRFQTRCGAASVSGGCDELRTLGVPDELAAIASRSHNAGRKAPARRIAQ
jgi:hypothetical protein